MTTSGFSAAAPAPTETSSTANAALVLTDEGRERCFGVGVYGMTFVLSIAGDLRIPLGLANDAYIVPILNKSKKLFASKAFTTSDTGRSTACGGFRQIARELNA